MTSVAVSKRQKAASKHSKQAACGSSNVHRCTDHRSRLPSAAATPGGGKAKQRRYPKSLMTRFFASEFFISHFPSTGPHHALSTNPLHCSKVHTLWKRSYIVWTSGLLLPCARPRRRPEGGVAWCARDGLFAVARGRRPERGVAWYARDGLLSNYKGPVCVWCVCTMCVI